MKNLLMKTYKRSLFAPLSLIFLIKKKITNMIANIMTILYILTVSDESIISGTLQKGTAIS